jgi:hypothetical protein
MGEAYTDSQREHYKDMLAKPRELVNALVLDDKEVDPTIAQIVEFSETQFDNILEQVELNDILDEFLDLTNGFNLKVSKTGTNFKNIRYTFSFERKPTAVNPTVMETITDLDAYVRSKFQDTERAVNALKSLTELPRVRSIGYSGDADTIDAEYSAVEDASVVTDRDADVEHISTRTAAEIEGLFDDQ